MEVRNNYNECLTNLACSIEKYFDIEYKHNTIEYIDKILEENKPKNVITILFDGMGSNILDRQLDKNDFLIKHRIKSITTVFPATTVAATTAIRTGLNPVESGMLGWNMYFKEIDKTIETFTYIEKNDETKTPLKEAQEYIEKYINFETISKKINENKKYKGYELLPFCEDKYTNLDDMFTKIEKLCNDKTTKYIYAYDEEPDHTMHRLGPDSKEVKELIKTRNKKVEELSKKLKDTIIFVIADHGHLEIENIFLEDYPDIINCLKRTTSIEPRAVNFFIKQDKKEEFKKLFNKYFSKDFNLYDRKDIIKSKLFGDGKENKIFRTTIGDFIAIGISNKTLLYGESILKSHHAGYTDDEIYIPLIVINTNKI